MHDGIIEKHAWQPAHCSFLTDISFSLKHDSNFEEEEKRIKQLQK